MIFCPLVRLTVSFNKFIDIPIGSILNTSLEMNYIYLSRSFDSTVNNSWQQLYLPQSAVETHHGDDIKLTNNTINIAKKGLYIISACVDHMCETPNKVALRIMYKSESETSYGFVSKVSQQIIETTQGVSVSAPIFANVNGSIKIETWHEKILTQSHLYVRVAKINTL